MADEEAFEVDQCSDLGPAVSAEMLDGIDDGGCVLLVIDHRLKEGLYEVIGEVCA